MATAGGVGFAPVAPGTVAAALAVALFVLLGRLSPALYLLTVGTLCVLGVWASERTVRAFGVDDDPRIVIDEVAGQLLALAPLAGNRASWPLVVTGFVAFRVFDVWKPGPIGRADRALSGGLGVMMDDVLAGMLAGLVVGAGLLLWPGGAG